MTKRNKIIYWISTLWLALGMLATGAVQLFKVKAEGAVSPPGVYGITHLGYPVYFLTILGAWKILGVIAILIPRFPLLKEWAYAGFAIDLGSALIAHFAVGDGPEAWGWALATSVLWGLSYGLWRMRALPVRDRGPASSELVLKQA